MEKINVTKSFLPPLEQYEHYLEIIWKNGQLTNQGPLLKEFEKKTSDYLHLDRESFHFVTNGTLALQIAIRSLDITEGEIITTPFSYVATTSAILWEHCTPVFVDIDPRTFCIDASKIEASITPGTKAILAVHVFGNPCDVEKIEVIAKKHNLKVIYDGAHAFGVKIGNRSLLSYGDISTCSFHATKLMHTIEGGAIVVNDSKLNEKVDLMIRFGHNLDDHIMLGINAKANEFEAAMGLCNLNYIDDIINGRYESVRMYNQHLNNRFIQKFNQDNIKYNYAYFPILLSDERELIDAIEMLNQASIYPRRYFYPSLNTITYIESKNSCPAAEDLSKRILCLPLYPGLEKKEIVSICNIINGL